MCGKGARFRIEQEYAYDGESFDLLCRLIISNSSVL